MVEIIMKMNCKKCSKNYDTINIKPEILFPCCHILCMVCLKNTTELLTQQKCPLCNEIIIEKQPSQDLINKLEQNNVLKQQVAYKLEQLEQKSNDLEAICLCKKQTNEKSFIKIEQDINAQVKELFEKILIEKDRLLEIAKDKNMEINARLNELTVEHNQFKGELNTMRLSLIDSNLINANELNMKLNIFENRIKHIRTKSALVNNNTQVFVMNDLKNLNINIGQINENNELKLPVKLNEDTNETQHEQHQLKSSITVQMSESEILNNVKIESMSETMDESSMLKRTTPTKFEDTQMTKKTKLSLTVSTYESIDKTITRHIEISDNSSTISKNTNNNLNESGTNNFERKVSLKNPLYNNIGDLLSSKIVKTLSGYSSYSLLSLPNCHLVSSSSDGKIRICNLNNNEMQILDGHTHIIKSLTLNQNSQYLISGSYDKTIKIWNYTNGKLVKQLDKQHVKEILALASLPNGILAASSDTSIKIYNLKTGSLLNTLSGHTNLISCLAVLPNNELASGSYDKTIRIWKMYTPAQATQLHILTGHTLKINACGVLPNGNLASCSNDSTIRIWDTNNGCSLRIITTCGSSSSNITNDDINGLLTLIVLNNGRLATGSNDSKIRIWDLSNKLVDPLVKVLNGHADSIISLVALDNGCIVSGSRDKTTRIWKI